MDRKPRWKRALLYMGVYLLGLFTPSLILTVGNPYALFFAAMLRVASEEIVRTTSPDGIVDAVLVRKNPGAFSGFDFQLYIVPKGGKPSGAPVLQAKDLSQERVEWKQPHLIEVSYDAGHIRQFGSLWHSDDVREGPYYVEIKLQCRSPGFALLNPKDGSL